MKAWWLALILIVCSVAATAQPYDEAADGAADVAQALVQAQKQSKPVLVVFGANWCGDCVALDRAFQQEPTAGLIQREFVLVKVDVGRFTKHQELSKQYGQPTKKGIPAAVVLNAKGEVVLASVGGELSNARRMSEAGIHDYFHSAAQQAKAKR
ncbi:thioredoxin family protein [Inhella gelatinilytica]|uniref:Thioredoxin family protein n=1 Tax=Inhella gelatinilytica TaxID=2795030 RepID=A0A931IV52_9BURK|nr:thioredoxin family protein [Inhella gelatinilytica]MBH9551248.1 thioredoxin family protein [Inhella gelatinilytica]